MRQLDAVGEIRKPPGCDISVFMLSHEDAFGDPIRVAVVPFQRMVTSMLEWPQDRASVRHLFIFFQGGGGGGGRQDLIYNV